jgi:hypothetical protein
MSQLKQWLPAPSILSKWNIYIEPGINAKITPIDSRQGLSHILEKHNIIHVYNDRAVKCLIKDLESRSHGGLDVQDFNILPILLKKRDKEIDSLNNEYMFRISLYVKAM